VSSTRRRPGGDARILDECAGAELRGFEHVKIFASGGIDEYGLRTQPPRGRLRGRHLHRQRPRPVVRPRHHGDRGTPDGQAGQALRRQAGVASPPSTVRPPKPAPVAPSRRALLKPSSRRQLGLPPPRKPDDYARADVAIDLPVTRPPRRLLRSLSDKRGRTGRAGSRGGRGPLPHRRELEGRSRSDHSNRAVGGNGPLGISGQASQSARAFHQIMMQRAGGASGAERISRRPGPRRPSPVTPPAAAGSVRSSPGQAASPSRRARAT
jgi:hypothetical protein